MQEWVDDLPEAINEQINDDVDVTFNGFEADFDDVKEALEQEHEKLGFEYTLQFNEAQSVNDLSKKIADIFASFKDGPFSDLNSGELKSAFDEMESNDFFVYVLATMSAGKSTLLNSLIGEQLLPSANLATTAKTSWIYDNDQAKTFSGVAFSADNQVLVPETPVNADTLSDWNKDAQIKRIQLNGNLPFVGDDTQRLVLVDTPGPNNSQDDRHREETERIINQSPKALVIYLLNSSQMATDDDAALLKTVAASMKGSKAARDRFIFVLSKMDGVKPDEIKQMIDKAKDYLAEQGIANARVFPVSAKTALDIRTVLKGQTTLGDYPRGSEERRVSSEAEELVDSNGALFLNEYSQPATAVEKEINARLAKAKADNNEVAEGEIYTGIPTLEEEIEFFVEKYAIPAKVRTVVEAFGKALTQSESVTNVKKKIAINKGKREEFKKIIDGLQDKLKSNDLIDQINAKIDEIDEDDTFEAEAKVSSGLFSDRETIINNIASEYDDYQMTEHDFDEVKSVFIKKLNQIQDDGKRNVTNFIQDEYVSSMKAIDAKFKQMLSNLEQDANLGALDLHISDLSVPDINQLVEKEASEYSADQFNTTERQVSDSRWYKPWTWGKKHIQTIAAETDLRDALRDIFTEFSNELKASLNRGVSQAKDEVKRRVRNSYTPAIKNSLELIKKATESMSAIVADDESLATATDKLQSELDWLESVRQQLNDAIEINK